MAMPAAWLYASAPGSASESDKVAIAMGKRPLANIHLSRF